LTHTIPLSAAHLTVFNGLGDSGEVPSALPWKVQPIEYTITFTPCACIHTTARCRSAQVLAFETYSDASGAMSIKVSATRVPWLSLPSGESQLTRSYVATPAAGKHIPLTVCGNSVPISLRRPTKPSLRQPLEPSLRFGLETVSITPILTPCPS